MLIKTRGEKALDYWGLCRDIIGKAKRIVARRGAMPSKIEEAVLYVSERAKDFEAYGRTKLNKILFSADFYQYGIEGTPITGVKYIHLQAGPVPHDLDKILASMQRNRRIRIEKEDYHGKIQDRPVSLVEADTSVFSEGELEVLDHFIEKYQFLNATELSERTHDYLPWLLTDHREEIPYNTVFVLRKTPVEYAAKRWALNELGRLRSGGYAH